MTPTIDYLMTLYEHNNVLIQRLMRSNEEIQRSIINMNTSSYAHTPVTRRNARYENDIRNALYRIMRPRQPMRMNNEFLEPISVFPSRQQIENATRRTRYGDIVRPVNTSCPISLDAFSDNDNVIMIRHCGHIFKIEEFNSWFGSHCRCPVCRHDIRDNILDVSGIANTNTNTNITANHTEDTINTINTTRNILNSLINNTEIGQNDVYEMLNLLMDSSSNYVSLHFDIMD